MKCDPQSDFNFYLGWVLVAGVVFCMFGPQWYQLHKRRSHVGMSLTNWLCATYVSYLQLANYFLSDYNKTFHCCGSEQTHRQCYAALEAFIQSALVEVSYIVVLVQYFSYYDVAGLVRLKREPADEWKQDMVKVKVAVVLYVCTTAIPTGIIWHEGGFDNDSVKTCGVVANVIASVLLATHWTFQMRETWILQSVGSLSLPGLFFASTGSLATMYSMFAHGGWAVAFSYLASAIMMGATFVLGCWVELQKKRRRRKRREDGASEHSKLVDSDDSDSSCGSCSAAGISA